MWITDSISYEERRNGRIYRKSPFASQLIITGQRYDKVYLVERH